MQDVGLGDWQGKLPRDLRIQDDSSSHGTPLITVFPDLPEHKTYLHESKLRVRNLQMDQQGVLWDRLQRKLVLAPLLSSLCWCSSVPPSLLLRPRSFLERCPALNGSEPFKCVLLLPTRVGAGIKNCVKPLRVSKLITVVIKNEIPHWYVYLRFSNRRVPSQS